MSPSSRKKASGEQGPFLCCLCWFPGAWNNGWHTVGAQGIFVKWVQVGTHVASPWLFPGASRHLVAGNGPLLASLARRTGRVPMTVPSRWLLFCKSTWPLCVSGRAVLGHE